MAAEKYSLGVAFSGGGAKAAAHCGALQALKEFGLKPDIMAGTSAGSLVAVYYAAGLEPVEILKQFLGMNFFKDIVAPALPKGGLFDSKPLVEHLRKTLPVQKFEDLSIPVCVVASEVERGQARIFSRGEIAPRVTASCSIPIIFYPMAIGGSHFVDGGAVQNLPVPAIRKQCRKVIAFCLNPIEDEPYRNNLIVVAMRSYSMMMRSNVAADARLADLFIDLDTKGCSVYDMSKLEELFRRGYASAVKGLEAGGYARVLPPESISFPKSRKTSAPDSVSEGWRHLLPSPLRRK